MWKNVLALVLAAPILAGAGAGIIEGPLSAEVVRVVDGDTIVVDALVWPGVTVRTNVRVDGVDTPEIRGECPEERDLAVRAREFVRGKVGSVVRLYNVRHGKYAGRVIAEVWVGEGIGKPLAVLLIHAGLGRRYDGGPRTGWCS